MRAFEQAVSIGYRYLETDIRVTADGKVMVFHDEDLVRLCGRPKRVSELTAAELARSRINGTEPIPFLDEVLDAWPDRRFNIDCKSDAGIRPLAEVINRHRALDRVCLTSFSDRRVRAAPAARTQAVHRRREVGAGAAQADRISPLGAGRPGCRATLVHHRRHRAFRPSLPSTRSCRPCGPSTTPPRCTGSSTSVSTGS